ncbi:MAG: hypothetical protein U0992_04120 [Planctomycetaceae bacterium]
MLLVVVAIDSPSEIAHLFERLDPVRFAESELLGLNSIRDCVGRPRARRGVPTVGKIRIKLESRNDVVRVERVDIVDGKLRHLIDHIGDAVFGRVVNERIDW